MKSTFLTRFPRPNTSPIKVRWIAIFLFFLIASNSLALQTPAPGTCFVYPSPATGAVAWAVYNMPQNGIATVYIYNEAGDLSEMVTDIQPAGLAQTFLDLTYYHRGIYMCRVVLSFDSGGTQTLTTFKFMVRR